MTKPRIDIKISVWIFTLMLFLVHSQLAAQSPPRYIKASPLRFQQLGENQGINNYSSFIYEDQLGFLWFGAGPEGLYRYDGYDFKHYEVIPEDTTSLPHNIVADIRFEDREGNLWLISGGEMTRYNRAKDNFTSFTRDFKAFGDDTWASIFVASDDEGGNTWLGSYGNPENPHSGGLIRIEKGTGTISLIQHNPADPSSLCNNGITDLYTDDEGVLWIGTRMGGLDRLVEGGGDQSYLFDHYHQKLEDPDDSLSTAIAAIAEDGNATLWVGTGNGVLRLNREKGLFERFRFHPDQAHPKNKVSCFPENPKENMWIGTRGGVAVYDSNRGDFTFYANDPADPNSISPGMVKKMVHLKDGSSWIITDDGSGTKGINRFDPKSGNFRLLSHQAADPHSLSHNIITDALTDRNGILWITTEKGGINKFDPKQTKFLSIYHNSIKAEAEVISEAKQPERVYSLCLDGQDRLWIGTEGMGLYNYDRKAGTITHFPYDPGNPSRGPRSGWIWDILEQPAGTLWIGGDSGLDRLDTRTMQFEHFQIDPEWDQYFGPNYIRQIAAPTPEKLWIATMGGGLFSFDVETLSFKSHLKTDKNPGGVPPKRLMSVYADINGTIWTGSLGGLHGYTPAATENKDSCVHYWYLPGDNNSIGSDMVGDIIMDKYGILWASTGGGGLNRIDTETGQIARFTIQDGLISNTITTLAMDRSDKIWIGSFSGLGRFDPETGACIIYDRSDGLPSMEITQGSTYQSAEGEIFLAGPGGIFYFHPDSIAYNEFLPPVVLTGLNLFNKALAFDPKKRLELKHNENFLSFEFAALNFTNSHKNQYRYRMIGLDQDTVFAGSRRTASYTDLKPGQYKFWVTGSNNDGLWNPEGTTLDITIHPPWYRSDLIIGLYVILSIGCVLAIIRWRTWKLINDKKILEKQVHDRIRDIEEKDQHILEMDRKKTSFFANVSHEFRTPITLILSPLEEIITRRKKGDPELRKLQLIRRNAKRLLNLVNQLLDLSKLDSGKLKQEIKKADVVKTLRLICSSFISLAEKRRIRYSFNLPERECITYFDAGKLETILNNLLTNAFKYTPDEGIIECFGRIQENVENGSIQLSISVIDSGPGIEPEKHEHIFDRFYQGDETQHMEGGGTGIGLSLTKELVELIHGQISLNSEPGEGSCFMVVIPLGREHLKDSEYKIIKEKAIEATEELIRRAESGTGDEPGEATETEDLPHAEHQHILIVEDNDDLRLYLKEQLQNQYKIIEAAAGDRGLKLALKHIPDLILTDVMMPGLDGIELCKRLKSNERTSHIPVIMLTARADFDSKITGLVTGADDYILKPFQIKELRTRIANLIRQRNMLRERFSGSVDKIAEDISINSYDLQFIRRITEVVEDHLSDLEFDVRKLQEKSGMSHTQLYRKLHALTGFSPSRFIRHFRLKRAEKLLEQHKGSVTHVAFEVGFGNLSYFTKCFKEEYGISPSEYARQFV